MNQINQTTEIPSVNRKKKVYFWKIIGITLLIAMLAPIVLTGLLYLYLNVADFKYDDPEQVIAQSTPMSFSQRNSFDAGSRTQIMRLDNADLYFLASGRIPELKYNDSLYINAYRLALEDSSIYIQGKAYGINIPVRIGIDVVKKDGSIIVKPTGASLGRWNIPVPIKQIAERLGLELEYELDLSDSPVFSAAKDVYIKDGYLQIELPIDKNLVAEGLGARHYLRPALLYMAEENEIAMLVEDYYKNWSNDNYVSEYLDSLLKEFQQDPEKYQEFKVKLLACGPEKVAEAYFSSEEYDQAAMSRFYPGITPKSVGQMRETLHFEQNYYFLRDFAFNIDSQFGQNIITVRNGRFIDKKSGKPVDWSSLYENNPAAHEVFPEGTEFQAILCLGANSTQKIGKRNYSCATAVKFITGRCAVICRLRDYPYITEISPQEYEDLVTGKASYYIVEMLE